jgi:glutamine amidotransferase
MSQTVAIIDYGMGNLHSVASAVAHEAPNATIQVTADEASILSAEHVIFPGVGAIRDCMAEIHRLGLGDTVQKVIAQQQPILGVCVGMQALMTHSEENQGVNCLDIFPAKVKLFQGAAYEAGHHNHLKVPHMGWNNVKQLSDHPVWHGIKNDERFYFVHSYFVDMSDPGEVIGECDYGQPFAAAFARDNLVAAQFHPEKSHTAGLRFLRNFLNWDGA